MIQRLVDKELEWPPRNAVLNTWSWATTLTANWQHVTAVLLNVAFMINNFKYNILFYREWVRILLVNGGQLNYFTCLFQLWIHFNLWKGWKPPCCRECSESHNQTSSRMLPNTSTAFGGTFNCFQVLHVLLSQVSCSRYSDGSEWVKSSTGKTRGKNDYIWVPGTDKWLSTCNIMIIIIIQSNHLYFNNRWTSMNTC